MSLEAEKEIKIIGGGVVGASIAHMTANILSTELEKARRGGLETPEITISVIEPAPDLGRGIPYTDYAKTKIDRGVAMNNQPNNRMSFDPNNIHAVSKLFNAENPESVGDDIISRVEIGDYATGEIREIREKLKASNISVSIQHIRASATKITALDNSAPQSFQIELDNNQTVDAEQLVVADGHQYNDDLIEFNPHNQFFGRYTNIEHIRDVIEHVGHDGAVGIRGTSQSMVDWLRILDHVGYQGKVHAYSRNNNRPWLFRPEDHPIENDDKEYKWGKFSPHVPIEALNELESKYLQCVFEQEAACAHNQGIGQGIILARTINAIAPKLQKAKQNNTPINPDLSAFFHSLVAKFGNPTPHFNMELIQKLEGQKQLKFIQGRIDTENTTFTNDAFTLNQGKSDEHKLNVLFDAAMFARSAFDKNGKAISPLLRGLHEQGLLKLDEARSGVFKAGEQHHPNLYIAKGPSTSRWKWGIESFRDQNHRISQDLANLWIPSNQ